MARSIQRLCRAVRVHSGAKPDGVANAFLWGSEEDLQVVKLQEPRLVLSWGIGAHWPNSAVGCATGAHRFTVITTFSNESISSPDKNVGVGLRHPPTEVFEAPGASSDSKFSISSIP